MSLRDDDKAARYVHALRLEGATFYDIYPELVEKYPCYSKIGVDNVRRQYNKWINDNNLDTRRRKYTITKPDHYFFRDNDNPKNFPQRASMLHLIDLKRAGHSPTRTELSLASSPDIIIPKKPEHLNENNDKSNSSKHFVIYATPTFKNKTPDELRYAHAVPRFRTPQNNILLAVSAAINIDIRSMLGPSRCKEYLNGRFMLFWLCSCAGYSLNEIGVKFERDHTTVLNGIRRFEKHLAEDGEYAIHARRLHSLLVTARPAPYWGA